MRRSTTWSTNPLKDPPGSYRQPEPEPVVEAKPEAKPEVKPEVKPEAKPRKLLRRERKKLNKAFGDPSKD